MRRIVTAAAALCALIMASFSPGWCEAPRVWHEQNTGVTRPFEKIVLNQAEFESTWKGIFRGQPVPAVDFQKEFAACICMGERKSGGYRVVFEGEYASGGKLIVPFWEKEPSGFVPQALTEPCSVKIIEKKPGLEPQLRRAKKQEL